MRSQIGPEIFARTFGRLRASSKTLTSSFLSLALRLVSMACTLATGVLLARMWGPADYGIYGLVISLSALAMNVVLLGTPQLAVREFAVRCRRGCWHEIRRLARLFQISVLAGALVLLGVTILAVYIFGGFLGLSASDLVIGALLTLLLAQTALLSSSLRGVGAMNSGQFIDILGRPAAALAVFAALYIGWGTFSINTALWVQLGVAVAALFVCQIWFGYVTHRKVDAPDQPDERTGIRPWLLMALPLGAIDILRQLDGTYGLVLLGWFTPGAELGLFRVALACSALITMPITIIHIILAPDVARLSQSGDKVALQKLLDGVSKTMTAISMAIAAGIFFVGQPVLIFAFGIEYAGAWVPLLLMALAQICFSLFGMGPILLAMAGQERALTIIYVLAISLGILTASTFLWAGWASAGAAFAQLVSLTVIAALSDLVAVRRLGVHASRIRWPWPQPRRLTP